MELILILALIGGVLGLTAIKKQQRIRAARFSQRKYYNPNEDYLKTVKEATKKRLDEEQSQQEYKTNVRKDYL
jgi:beta-lactamase regulating signal transducer with metallopeptidase domain